jgi:predicted HTH transcriptional regulator
MPKPLEEFQKLQEARPEVSKTSNDELLAFLSKQMATTKEVSQFLQVENGTAFSRLRRLVKAGKIIRRWEGNRSYWVTRKAVGLPDAEPVEEEEEDAA